MEDDEDYVPSDEHGDEDGLDDDDMEEDLEDETAFLTANRGQDQDAGDGMLFEYHRVVWLIISWVASPNCTLHRLV